MIHLECDREIFYHQVWNKLDRKIGSIRLREEIINSIRKIGPYEYFKYYCIPDVEYTTIIRVSKRYK